MITIESNQFKFIKSNLRTDPIEIQSNISQILPKSPVDIFPLISVAEYNDEIKRSLRTKLTEKEKELESIKQLMTELNVSTRIKIDELEKDKKSLIEIIEGLKVEFDNKSEEQDSLNAQITNLRLTNEMLQSENSSIEEQMKAVSEKLKEKDKEVMLIVLGIFSKRDSF